MKIFMIVDDSPVIRKVARRILEGMGHVIVEATDGLDALEKCNVNMPDAIIVDSEMPRMNGVEFITQFKFLKDSENTKLLFCTSEVILSEMTKAKRAGCHGYIVKPFTRDILLNGLVNVGIEAAAA
ncbi:MAG: response regulator [Hyphomicrobiales bacterium]|nr:response regulator [Hyphomicrobiales bacterium]